MMKNKLKEHAELQQAAQKVLNETIGSMMCELGSLKEVGLSDIRLDMVIPLANPHGTVKYIAIEPKLGYEPFVLSNAIDQMKYEKDRHLGLYPILVVYFAGSKLIKICKDSGIGIIDLIGNAEINFDYVCISHRSTKKNPYKKRTYKINLNSDPNNRIIEQFVKSPDKMWTSQSLAEAAQVSTYTVHYLCKYLDELGIVAKTTRGFSVCNMGKLDALMKESELISNGRKSE